MTPEQKAAHERMQTYLPIKLHFQMDETPDHGVPRPVEVNGRQFPSLKAAAMAIGKAEVTLRKMICQGSARYIDARALNGTQTCKPTTTSAGRNRAFERKESRK